MVDALYYLWDFIFRVINDLLVNISVDYHNITPWENIIISPGIGQVTWFSIELIDLIGIILYLVIIIAVIRYTIKFVKWIWSFASRLFGGK